MAVSAAAVGARRVRRETVAAAADVGTGGAQNLRRRVSQEGTPGNTIDLTAQSDEEEVCASTVSTS